MSKRENLPNEERSSPVCYGHSHELREEFRHGDTFAASEKEREEIDQGKGSSIHSTTEKPTK